jgi:hypothetical protein
MKETYRSWLEQQKYEPNTIAAQVHRVGRVEKHCGDLEEHYQKDRMASLIKMLTYSSSDERANRPNPTPIPIDGRIRSNLASYRDAIKRYLKFRESSTGDIPGITPVTPSEETTKPTEEDLGQRFGLERDMQAALRIEIGQLEPGLVIIDDGAERSVDSGFIDITARDVDGATVVIELKAGAAGQRAIAQILTYMGDVAAEDDNMKVRGILVASEFDSRAKAAARMVPNLVLRKYSVRFTFSDGGT